MVFAGPARKVLGTLLLALLVLGATTIAQCSDISRRRAVDSAPLESADIFSQLLFSYKLNPQTVLFLGYEENRADNFFDTAVTPPRYLASASPVPVSRFFFLKIGYAIMFESASIRQLAGSGTVTTARKTDRAEASDDLPHRLKPFVRANTELSGLKSTFFGRASKWSSKRLSSPSTST